MEKTRILVWDLPLRVFHWALAIAFVGAFLTAESERYREVHAMLGYGVFGLLAFRLLWAFVGPRYARLSSFAFGPRAVLGYLKSLVRRQPLHYVGHNPAGSWVIYALVIVGLVSAASGYAVYTRGEGNWLEELHEAISNAMLGLVIVHVAGVVVSSFLHRENLVVGMLTGRKRGRPEQAIHEMRWPAALALVLGVTSLSAALQQLGPVAPSDAESRSARTHGQEQHEGHDDPD